ncbi:MAG: hypothetical protein Q9217_002853 [Psora testacea]
MSAWFHGESVIGDSNDEKRPRDLRKVSQHRQPAGTARARLENYSPGLRSPTSTRSLIDPEYSPRNFSRPLTYDPFADRAPSHGSYVRLAFASPTAIKHPPKKQIKPCRYRVRSNHDIKLTLRTCLPHTTNPRIRQKTIGTLVSGTLLMIVLTAYLALATSNIVPTTTFHAVFIFFILLLTMVFAHFLIRLCMLSSRLRPSKHVRKSRRYRLRNASTPIRLTQPRDEEEGLDSIDNDSVDTEKDLPAPPPAYGWWRGSVRVDPEDIRYHDPDQSDLQQTTRSLVFAGSGHAPPSYTT